MSKHICGHVVQVYTLCQDLGVEWFSRQFCWAGNTSFCDRKLLQSQLQIKSSFSRYVWKISVECHC